MTAITTLTGRELADDLAAAKRAAEAGPVFVTEGGLPAMVLLSMEEYRRLSGGGMSALESLAQTDPAGDFPYDFGQFRSRELPREIDLGFDD